MQNEITITPTIAVDLVEDTTELYEGFYEGADELNAAGVACTSGVDWVNADRQKRLLKSVRELDLAMKKASLVDFDKIRNAHLEEEEKRKAEALRKRIEEAMKLMDGKKRQIFISLYFLNLSEVDAFKETFAAEVAFSHSFYFCREKDTKLCQYLVRLNHFCNLPLSLPVQAMKTDELQRSLLNHFN